MEVKIFHRRDFESYPAYQERIQQFSRNVFIIEVFELQEDIQEKLPPLTVVFYRTEPKTLKEYNDGVCTGGIA